MSVTNVRRTIFCAFLVVGILGFSARPGLAQGFPQTQPGAAHEDQTNLNLELYMIAATSQPREGKIPASLDSVVRQLRDTLPFRNYSLETTMVNRVRNGGSLSLSSYVGLLPNPAVSNRPPIFNDFSIARLSLVPDSNGGQTVQLLRFAFGSRVPIQTGTNIAPSGTNSAPVYNYDQVGIKTDISVREGQPAVVGTLLNASSSGEAIVLVVLVKRVLN